MNRTPLTRAVFAATVLTGSVLTSTPAQAEMARPNNFVTLSVQDGAGNLRTTTLGCHPTRGMHPRAEQACETLTAAKGEFDALEPQTAQCPMIYRPVNVAARGIWRNESLDYTASFSNDCVARAQTGGVFDF